MLTPSSVHTKISYQPNGFPVYTTQSGIHLTFEPKENSYQSGRFIADKTWKGIAKEYNYLNPGRYQKISPKGDDRFSIKYNTQRGHPQAYQLLFESMSMQELVEKEQHIQALYDEISAFMTLREYMLYVDNHAASGSGGMRFKPEYQGLLYNIASFLSVINHYKNSYQQTMKHISILHRAGHDITTLLLDSKNTSHV